MSRQEIEGTHVDEGFLRAKDAISRAHDENISLGFAEAPLLPPCEESRSDREHVKVVETCAMNGG